MSAVCRETGVVDRVDRGFAHVSIERVDACNTCESKGACQTLGGKAKDIVIKVENTVGAAAGDRVVLELAEVSVIQASAAVYLIPAVGLTGGAVLGAEMGLGFLSKGDGATLVGAVLGLLVGFGLSHLIARRIASNPELTPRLLEITSTTEPNASRH